MKGLYPLFVLFPLPCSGGFLTAPQQQRPLLLNEIDHAGCPFLGHDILSGSPSYGHGRVFFTKLFQRMGRPKPLKLYGLGEPFTSVSGKETVKEVLKDEPKEEGGSAARIDMRPCLVQSTPPLDIIGRAREQRDVNEIIVENIKLVLAEHGISPILITIGGSRAKGVASDAGSDYDTNVIGLHSRRDYLLQKVNPSFRFTADVAGIDGEVEGVVSDYVRMQRYILDSNMKAYDTFAGITVYTTPLAEEVRKIYLRVFESARLASSLRGMLFGYRDKKLNITPELQGETTNKLACEAAYLAMKLLYIESSSASMGTTADSPPPYEITELMDKCRDNLSEDEREWIRSLVDSRIANKTATFVVTEKFCELIDRALRVKPACSNITRTTTTGKKERAGAPIALEDLFLGLFSKDASCFHSSPFSSSKNILTLS